MNKTQIIELENKFLDIARHRYINLDQNIQRHLLETSIEKTFDINKFYDEYLNNGKYPKDRLDVLISYLLDVKAEMMMIFDELGRSNKLADEFSKEFNHPTLIFKRVSIDQTVIIKSRIVFEKIMNFIFYLEKGEHISGKTSKKKKFFKWLDSEKNKWKFLCLYKTDIECFDKELRTPEVHFISELNKRLLDVTHENNDVFNEKMLVLINIFQNIFYQNMLLIIKGEEATNLYWAKGMSTSNEEIMAYLKK